MPDTTLSNTSRFTRIHLEIDPLLRQITSLSYRIAGNASDNHIQFPFGVFPVSGETGYAELSILREIYNSADGFRDAEGDAVTVDMPGVGDFFGITTLAELQAHADFSNPFLISAPQNEEGSALTSLGDRYYNLRLWQVSATKPADPPSEWWGDDGLVYPLGSWHLTRASAVLNGTAGDPVWFALDALSIGDNHVAYNGWDVFREFGVEYSADETNWHATQADDDIYFAFITPTGTRKIVEIAPPPDLDWTQLYFGTPYNAGSGVQIEFGSNINFDLYKRLRFTFQPFGYWQSGGDPGNRGAQISTIFPKPHIDGWESSTGANITSDDDSTGTFTWVFDEINGASVIPHEHGSRDSMDIPSSIVRTGTDPNGRGLPARRIAGKGKWGGPDSNTQHIIHQLRMYDFGSNSNYERFTLRIEGATY